MSRTKIFEGGIFAWDNTATQLTAPGVTTAVDVLGSKNHTFQVTVAAVNTNITAKIEGTVDGTSYFILPLESTAVTGLTITAHVATITANGTYLLYVKDVAITNIRFRFATESGGTAATVNAILHSSN